MNTRMTRRRGTAMMLVLVGLMTATILATAYVSSRDNSSVIGDNIVATSEAKWLAQAGLEIGLTALQVSTDWRIGHSGGRLVENHSLGNGVIHIDVADADTMLPPTDETCLVELTITAVVDGLERQSSAVVEVRPISTGRARVDLTEFVLFTNGNLSLTDNATITRWTTAPLARLGKRLKIGTLAEGAGAISFSGDAVAVDTTVYHGPDASPLLVSEGDGPAIGLEVLLDDMPLPQPPSHDVEEPNDGSPAADLELTGDATVNSSRRIGRLEIDGGVLRIQGETTIVIEDRLEMDLGATIQIDGDVTLVVFDKMELRDSAIELTDGSSLTVFAGAEVELEDAYVGNDRVGSTDRDASGSADYMPAERVRFYAIPGAEPSWRLLENSVVKASVYAPTADVRIRNESALYGNLTADTVEMDGDAAVFYDHSLDSGLGYTNPHSPAFTDDGHLDPDVLAVSVLPREGWIQARPPDDAEGSTADRGACCLGGSCARTTETWCVSRGGVYKGDDTTCSQIRCDADMDTGAGACCILVACTVLVEELCNISGGTYRGDGVQCSAAPCTSAFGACCFEDTCMQTTETNCGSYGGQFMGHGERCASTNCDAVTGVDDPEVVPDPNDNVAVETATYNIRVIGMDVIPWENLMR